MTSTPIQPDDQPDAATSGNRRTTVWMILAGVAILAAIGLGVWAVNVHSDLEDQQAATQAAEAQAAAQKEAADAAAAEIEKINADNEVYVVSNEDVAQAESELAAAENAVAQANAAAAEASSAVATAQDEASNLRAELGQARAERDLARAERQQARLCARGSLGVISSLGKGDGQATSEMETIASACAASVPG